jgi:hypothetical protein
MEVSQEARPRGRPKAQNSLAASEMDKAEAQFDKFDAEIKEMTLDRMNQAPKLEVEPQTKLSQNEIARSKDIYLKPFKSIGVREKFNENFRASWEFDKEYVHFTAENKEIIGETIEMWTKPYAGVSAEFWKVPVNKPVWGPRYLAEQIKRCSYHRLKMDETQTTGRDGTGVFYGQMAVDNTVQRMDAMPVSSRKSIFLGASGF